MKCNTSSLKEKLEREVGEIEEMFEDKDVEEFEEDFRISPSSKFFIDGYEVVKFVAREPDDLSFVCYYYEVEVSKDTYVCFRQEDKKIRDKTVVEIFGTSHNSTKSVDKIEEKFEKNNYDKCMVELDEKRADELMKETSTKLSLLKIAIIPIILFSRGNRLISIVSALVWPFFILSSLTILFLRILGWILEKIANLRGRNYRDGLEFRQAIIKCRETDTELVLIDRDMIKTFSDYWNDKEVSKFRVVYLILSLWALSSLYVVFGRNKSVTEVISEDKYPIISRHFHRNRDNYMAGEILSSTDNNEKVLVVVGAKHVKGIEDILNEYDFEQIKTDKVDKLY